MSKTTYALPFIALVFSISAACDQMGSSNMEMAMTVDLEALRAEIDETNQAYIEAYNAGDAAAMTALYTADAIRLPPDGSINKGREQIMAAFTEEFGMSSERNLHAKSVEIGAEGMLAYEVGEWSETSIQDGEESSIAGTYVVVWKRTADGALRLHVETWTEEEAEME